MKSAINAFCFWIPITMNRQAELSTRGSTAPDCYTSDWQRTKPDLVLFLPQAPVSPHGDNEHRIVNFMPRNGEVLATWTTGTYESSHDTHTVFSRSRDDGVTWSRPQPMPGTFDGPLLGGRWGVHIVSRAGRVYLFFNKCLGLWD